jgi:hypothetical protein
MCTVLGDTEGVAMAKRKKNIRSINRRRTISSARPSKFNIGLPPKSRQFKAYKSFKPKTLVKLNLIQKQNNRMGNPLKVFQKYDYYRGFICSNRQKRKNVLHALKKTGRIGQRSPRWTIKSRLTCK